MGNVSIRAKIIILLAISLISLGAVIISSVGFAYKLTEFEIDEAKKLMLEGQKEKIKAATESLAGCLGKALAHEGSESGKIEMLRMLTQDALFEEDSSGYFYVYKGTLNVAHPINPELHGQDLSEFRDADGVYPIRRLAKAAQSGGDFVRFHWVRPGESVPEPKLGYATMIPGTDYWIGTGVYIKVINERAQAIRTVIESHNSDGVVVQVSIASSLLFLLFIVGLIISRNIINPIEATKRAALKIASGDMDVALTLHRKDEVGQLQKALASMVQSLKANMQHLAEKEAEAQRKADEAELAANEVKEAKSQAELKTTELLDVAQELDSIVETVTMASDQLLVQIEQSSAGASAQSHQIEETVKAIEEMTTAVVGVASNAAQAADAVDSSREMAQEGADVVNKAVLGIGQIADQSKVLMDDMTILGNGAESIGNIINVINDIADQTNLLALNAAIEAARAGETGRGFAVVADEVRKLAEKTMSATNDVTKAIKTIQEGTSKNVESTVQSVEIITRVTDLAEASGQSLREIVELVNNANQQVQSIAASSHEQTAASEEISKSVAGINIISAETSTAMESSRQVVADLAKQIRTLKALTERMRAQSRSMN